MYIWYSAQRQGRGENGKKKGSQKGENTDYWPLRSRKEEEGGGIGKSPFKKPKKRNNKIGIHSCRNRGTKK